MFRAFILASTFALSFAGQGSAANLTLDCTMTNLKDGGGYIPESFVFRVNTASKKATLVEPNALELPGSIKATKLLRNDASRLIVRWDLVRTRSSSNQQTPVFKFRALFKKDTKVVDVIAKPLGYGNDFRGKGTCTLK